MHMSIEQVAMLARFISRSLPGMKIEQIKQLRTFFPGIGLRGAKDIIEAVDNPPVDPVVNAVRLALNGYSA